MNIHEKNFMDNSRSFVFKTKREARSNTLHVRARFLLLIILVFKRFLILLGYRSLLHDQR